MRRPIKKKKEENECRFEGKRSVDTQVQRKKGADAAARQIDNSKQMPTERWYVEKRRKER